MVRYLVNILTIKRKPSDVVLLDKIHQERYIWMGDLRSLVLLNVEKGVI